MTSSENLWYLISPHQRHRNFPAPTPSPPYPLVITVFFFRDIFFSARDNFRKTARDIKKTPVTKFGKSARDISDFKVQNTTTTDDFN